MLLKPEVLTSPSCGDGSLSATQDVVYLCSDVSWKQLEDSRGALKDAWLRLRRKVPVPPDAARSAIRVLGHRLFLRYADASGWTREDLLKFANPARMKSAAELTTSGGPEEVSAAGSSHDLPEVSPPLCLVYTRRKECFSFF